MRILHLIASADPAGGGPLEGILRQERETGGLYPLAVREMTTLDRPDAPYLAKIPMKVNALGRSARPPRTPWGKRLAKHGYTPGYGQWVRDNATRFDVVLVHGLWNFASFGATRALRRSGVPYFVFTHGMLDPWFRRRYPIKHAVKQFFWTLSEGRLLAGARAVLFTSEEERRLARTSFFGHDYRELVIDYGTSRPPEPTSDDSAIVARVLPGLGDRPCLLFLSRIHEKKGCDLLLRGFAQAATRDDLQLVIAGPGDATLVAELKRLASSLGIEERVHWPGPLYDTAKWALFRRAEAFVLPSHQENFGIAVAEALACGLPVLISDHVNIWREISEAGAGLVAPPTVRGTARLLTDWITLPIDARQRMAAAGRELFFERFDVARTARRLLAQLRSESAGQPAVRIG